MAVSAAGFDELELTRFSEFSDGFSADGFAVGFAVVSMAGVVADRESAAEVALDGVEDGAKVISVTASAVELADGRFRRLGIDSSTEVHSISSSFWTEMVKSDVLAGGYSTVMGMASAAASSAASARGAAAGATTGIGVDSTVPACAPTAEGGAITGIGVDSA
jgi:hypothetical protein